MSSAQTISYTLTATFGCPTVKIRATIQRAGDRLLPTIPYDLFIETSGGRAPTLHYTLTVEPLGCPTIEYTATLADMSFVFGGAPPVCSVSPPFVIHGKPLPPIIPVTVNAPSFPAIPDFNFSPIYNELGDLNFAMRQLQQMVQQMGAALSALRQRQQNQEKNNSNNKNQQKKDAKASSFVEVKSARVKSKHKITNPDDDSQFATVEQIDGLLFRNNAGQTITWRR